MMQFSEWIGLFITLFAFAFLIWNNFAGAKRPDAEEQQKRLAEFLKGVNLDMQPPQEVPLQRQKKDRKKVKPAAIQQEMPRIQIRKSAPAEVTTLAELPNPVSTAVKSLHSKKQMVIFRELLDSPRAMRPWNINRF